MLTNDVAQERLKEWRHDDESDPPQRILGGIKSLAPNLREIAFALIDRDENGDKPPDKTEEQEKAGEKLLNDRKAKFDALSSSDRTQILEVSLGRFAPHVEAGWRFLKSAATDADSCWYRAPNNPELTRESRLNWLRFITNSLTSYRSEILTPEWVAVWTPYFARYWQDDFGKLLASMIDAGGKEGEKVFEVLCDIVNNRHEIGCMGRHVTQGLLMSSRQEGWELMEKMLLAAQRQEGLRQVLLESIPAANLGACQRILKTIVEHKLARFSSVAQALNDWLGYSWDSASVGVVNKTIETVVSLLEDPAARTKALSGSDGEAAYLALWTTSLEDVGNMPPLAEKLLGHKKVEMRYAAVTHLAQFNLPITVSAKIKAVGDDDLRVAHKAVESFESNADDESIGADLPLFENVEKQMAKIDGKTVATKPLVWPWTSAKIERSDFTPLLMQSLGNRSANRLLPHLGSFKYGLSKALELFVKDKSRIDEVKPTLLGLIESGNDEVREETVKTFKGVTLTDAEIERLEKLLLTKKGQGVRRDVCTLIHRQNDDAVIGRSVNRLLSAKDGNQRLAGLAIARQCIAEKRESKPKLVARVNDYVQSKGGTAKLPKDELVHVEAIQSADEDKPTLDDALGLADLSGRSPVPKLQVRNVEYMTSAAYECLKSLDALVHQHRETSIKYKKWNDEEVEELLGSVNYGFPNYDSELTVEDNRARLPLCDVWEKWYADRSAKFRDADGRELLRAEKFWNLVDNYSFDDVEEWAKTSKSVKAFLEKVTGRFKKPDLKYDSIVSSIVRWLKELHSPRDVRPFLFDAAESALASVSMEDHKALIPSPKKAKASNGGDDDEDEDDDRHDWRDGDLYEKWLETLQHHFHADKTPLSPEENRRYWGMVRFLEEPIPNATRKRAEFSEIKNAYDAGLATFADVADSLLGPRVQERYSWRTGFDSFGNLTDRNLSKENRAFLDRHPEVAEFLDKARARILELELARSDTPTAATPIVQNLGSLFGVETLFRILSVIGKNGFKTQGRYSYYRQETPSKVETLTNLAKVVFPRETDTQEQFNTLAKQCVKESGFTEQNLLELMFLAPQWAKFVERYFAWPGLSEGLYWFLAHMKYINADAETAASSAGYQSDSAEATAEGQQPKERKSAWDRLIAERTPLTDAERREGAVDVAWFQRTYEQLTAKRWESLAKAARFAANAAQARKAKYLGEILLGTAKKKDLIDGIKKKYLKDSVRLLGLLPLATGAKRDADIAERYKTLVGYRQYAKGLSSMTKPEAFRALEIGMRNLASIAGYSDPMRLEWAMEADAVADLAKGPVSATKEGVTVTLSLDDLGRPQTSITKAGKELKGVPPAVKKDAKIAAVTERVADLKKQASRVKESLERAMCKGDTFTAAELLQLAEHAVLWPQLSRLVLVGEGILGYPDKKGKALRNHAGKLEPIKKKETLRIAHPQDLFETGEWSKWQHDCFTAERVQPFKQVFRELYLVTGQEKKDKTKSLRYAGQQVNSKQASALWNARNWSTDEGVYKVFHDEKFTASVGFNYGFTTPLEVEGWTLDSVSFTKHDDYKPIALPDVAPRIFSEVMRDLDLVVSVAHRGGVDPEASASTVEMRASLLRETCQLLKINNIKIKEPHVVIDGKLSDYSVHLGSANVHRMPGGSLCIVPVHSQHRGRLFLPFADDDPRTAEVVSKVILLAKDSEIQDPIILDQLRR